MISKGYKTNRIVTGPMNFKKNQDFFRKTVLPDFGAPGCHPSTLIDNANTALASKCSLEPICIISEGYRTHGAVTGPMKFKKKDVFFRKIVLPGFWAPGCNPCTLIDLANTALASRGPVKPLCMISKGYRTNRFVTGPMNFKKSGRFFFFSGSRAPGTLGPWLQSVHLN